MYKLCAFLGVGPRFETRIPFDAIFYSDRAQFHMEKCQGINMLTWKDYEKNKHKLEHDLKRCLKTLHSYHIVHRDIKPANVLFARNAFVLADFGLTDIIEATV